VPVLAWLYGYSHSKRFTLLCHLWLGISLGLAPLAAWVAADGAFSTRLWPAACLGLGVTCWVAGFDVLYSCQDEAFDRQHGLHSIPAALGIGRAMTVSRCLHAVAVVLFLVFGRTAGLGPAYHVGLLVAAGLLVWQHRLLRPGDLSRMQTAFFTANGAVSLLLCATGCVDLWWH
jgi:4-hydroxybenzoate polyprenyltransferase